MSPTTLLTLGGIYAVCGVIFHLAFWKIFDWPKSLSNAGFINRQVIQVLNLCLTLVFALFAVGSLFYQTDLLTTGIGNWEFDNFLYCFLSVVSARFAIYFLSY